MTAALLVNSCIQIMGKPRGAFLRRAAADITIYYHILPYLIIIKYTRIYSRCSRKVCYLLAVISTERQRVEKSISKARNKVRFLHAFASLT